jgi:5-methylcytosine-specific restriction enzyme subunit McrC
MCSYEELDFNITINKILKTTIINLLKLNQLTQDNRKHLKQVLAYFSTIDTIYLDERVFKGIRYNPSNKAYEFIINICKLVKDNLLMDEKGEGAGFYNFLEDERKMAYLFENFVRNFYKKELKPSKIYRENILWNLSGEDLNYLPLMQTDISIELPNKKIIMDTKYYRAALNINLGKEKLHSSNLYQLFAYLKNNESKSLKDKNSEGILLYPRVNKDLDLTYTMEGHIMKVCTVNLDMKWQNIEERLLEIVS